MRSTDSVLYSEYSDSSRGASPGCAAHTLRNDANRFVVRQTRGRTTYSWRTV